MILAPGGDFSRTGCLAWFLCFGSGIVVLMNSVFSLDFGFTTTGCPDAIRCYRDLAEASQFVCGILRRFFLIVFCAVVLTASRLPLPYCSFVVVVVVVFFWFCDGFWCG